MGVGAVWGGGFYSGDQVLVEEDLTDVADGVGDVCAVVEGCSVLVCDDVDVGGATGVVTREDGEPLRHTVFVGGLDSA